MRQILVFLVCFPLLTGISFGQEKQADELLSKAIYQEEVKGNLEEAILIYTDIIKKYPEQRAITAEALFHLGLSNEKLGNKKAQEYYETIVNSFGDQPKYVRIAKERLSKLMVVEKELEIPLVPTFTKIKMPDNPGNGVLSPDGKRIAFIKNGDVWAVPVSGGVDPYIVGEPQKLTDDIGAWGMNSTMAWSGNGKWIAFNAEYDLKSSSTSIYIVSSKGGNSQKVQVPYRKCGWPQEFRLSLSPDGSILAYATINNSGDDESIRIYTMPVNGGTPKELAGPLTQEPAFSPDGSKIAFVKNYRDNKGKRHSDVWVIPTEGGNPIQVSNLSSGQVRGPVWSADGNMIAFHRRRIDGMAKEIWIVSVTKNGSPSGAPQKIELPHSALHAVAGWTPDNKIGLHLLNPMYEIIYTVPSSGGIATQVTPKGSNAAYPKWSTDGKRIYFRGDYGIISFVPSGGGTIDTIIIDSEFNIYSAVPGSGNDISPDGKTIVFSGTKNFYKDNKKHWEVNIFTIPVEGGKPKQLTTHEPPAIAGYPQDRFPCWSPDGNSVAFIRLKIKENNPIIDIYLVSKDGKNLRKITAESHEVAWAPIDWTPDGKSITYFSYDNTIKSILIDGSDSRVLTKINKVNRHYELAWSPDDNELAFTDKRKLWILPYGEDIPTEVKTGVDEMITKIGWSPDGKKIAFTAYGGGDHELWLMEDFLPLEKLAKSSETDAMERHKKVEQCLKKGEELFNQWEYSKAIKEFEKVIDLDPNSLLAMNAKYYIGQSQFRDGQHNNALSTFKKLIKENPESNFTPVTELMITQVENEMKNKSTIVSMNVHSTSGDSIVDSKTGITYRKIKTFTGNSDVIEWVASTHLSPNGKFLLSFETIIPMDGTKPFTYTDLNVDDSKWSPDGTKIAFTSDSSIYVANITPATAKKVRPINKLFSKNCEIYGINWAPDSNILFFSLLDEAKKDYPEIYALNVSNETIKQITNESIPLVAPSCSPDGQILACTGMYSDLWFCPVDGGKAKQISDGNSVMYTGPNWSPNGTLIYSDETRKGWGRSLNFIQVENENEVKLTPPEKTGTFLSFSRDGEKMYFLQSSYRIFWGMKIASSSGGPSYEPAPHIPVYGAQWSTSSKMLIVQGEGNNKMEEGDAAIRVIPISGGESYVLNMDVNLDGKPFAYCITPDQKNILFVTKKEGDITDNFYMAPISFKEARVTGPPIMIIENWNRGGAHNTKLSMSYDGTKLAIINNEDIWIYDLNNKILKQITNTPGKKKWVAWSPDGKMLSYQYFLDQPEFKAGSCIISSTDGQQIKKIEDYLLWPYGWSPDSKSVVYEQEGKIVNHNLAMNKIKVITEPKSLGLRWIARYLWSPDGENMLLDVRKENEPEKYFLYKYSLHSGELTEIASNDTSYKYDFSWSPDGKWICYCYYESEKYLPESTLWEADFEEVKEKLISQENN